jgi:hypothetical protein
MATCDHSAHGDPRVGLQAQIFCLGCCRGAHDIAKPLIGVWPKADDRECCVGVFPQGKIFVSGHSILSLSLVKDRCDLRETWVGSRATIQCEERQSSSHRSLQLYIGSRRRQAFYANKNQVGQQ